MSNTARSNAYKYSIFYPNLENKINCVINECMKENEKKLSFSIIFVK